MRKKSFFLCSLFTISENDESVAFGVLHCVSSWRRMPFGVFSIRSMHPWLSWYSIGVHRTFSSEYSISSDLKTNLRKNCCSFSFAKLIASCSNELFVPKNSKPKTSSSPMKVGSPVASPTMLRFTAPTIESNRRVYTALQTASRAKPALCSVEGLDRHLGAHLERALRQVLLELRPQQLLALGEFAVETSRCRRR